MKYSWDHSFVGLSFQIITRVEIYVVRRLNNYNNNNIRILIRCLYIRVSLTTTKNKEHFYTAKISCTWYPVFDRLTLL